MWNGTIVRPSFLDPVRLARSHGFAANEINRIEKLILENHERLLDSWNEFSHG
jgi:hypothetical protein